MKVLEGCEGFGGLRRFQWVETDWESCEGFDRLKRFWKVETVLEG